MIKKRQQPRGFYIGGCNYKKKELTVSIKSQIRLFFEEGKLKEGLYGYR